MGLASERARNRPRTFQSLPKPRDSGRPRDEEIAKLAGQAAVEGARPLNFNQFKIPLLANLVKRAVENAGTRSPATLTSGSRPSGG